MICDSVMDEVSKFRRNLKNLKSGDRIKIRDFEDWYTVRDTSYDWEEDQMFIYTVECPDWLIRTEEIRVIEPRQKVDFTKDKQIYFTDNTSIIPFKHVYELHILENLNLAISNTNKNSKILYFDDNEERYRQITLYLNWLEKSENQISIG